MSKDARNENLDLTPAEQEKFNELIALLTAHHFGPAGPLLDTTFAGEDHFVSNHFDSRKPVFLEVLVKMMLDKMMGRIGSATCR